MCAVKITKDKVAEVLKAISFLTRQQVLVGIPGENASRDDGPITNPAIGAIMEFGYPPLNIPPRPFLVPGVRAALPVLIPKLKRVGQQALDFKGVGVVTEGLIGVGLAAASAVQMKITTGPFEPIKDATKRARLRRKAGYRKASDARKAKMMAKWMGGDFAPLIDSGALRASISFAIRPK